VSGLTVTTIIPAYQASRTIGRAVESVIGQTRPSDEILVVDDGSRDDLKAALEAYRPRVTLIRKPNGGAASARNLGIDLAGGDLIAFLDADDYWEPNKLERQVGIFESHPEVGATGARFFNEPPGQPRRLSPAVDTQLYGRVLNTSGDEVFEVIKEFCTPTLMVRRDALGSHRFVSGLEPAEDRDLWVRLIASFPFYLAPEPLATVVLEPGSLSRTNIDRDCSNMLRVLHRNRDMLSRAALRDWESDLFRRWAAGHLGVGRPDAALTPACKRLRLQPTSPEAWWILCKCLITLRTAARPAADG
jgi:glycosyltransferase involved in cell wall biosynthesis